MTMTWPNKSPEPTAVGAYRLSEKVSVVPRRSSAVAQLFSLGGIDALCFAASVFELSQLALRSQSRQRFQGMR